ncbi:MAG: helix-turn-helix transcriptional regulator [Alphaproteobacteria bacterium]
MLREDKVTSALKIKVAKSSGNVFRDLGLADADGLELKAMIALRVVRAIEERGLTQVQVAELLGLKQPKVSALMNGKISGFSIERLLRFLTKLGHDVTISHKKRRKLTEGEIKFATAA